MILIKIIMLMMKIPNLDHNFQASYFMTSKMEDSRLMKMAFDHWVDVVQIMIVHVDSMQISILT